VSERPAPMSPLSTSLRLLALLAFALFGARGVSPAVPGTQSELADCAPGGSAPGASWSGSGARLSDCAAEASEAESEEEGHDGPAPLGGPYSTGRLRLAARRARASGPAQRRARARQRRDLARGPPRARA